MNHIIEYENITLNKKLAKFKYISNQKKKKI